MAMSSVSSVTERSLFSLSWPIFIDLFLHFLTLMINTAMVSHVSTKYLAAIGAGNLIFNICITVFNFIGIGSSVIIAQYLGAKNEEKARETIHVAIAFNFLLGLSLSIFLFFCGNQILLQMNTPDEIIADAYSYLHIMGFCLIPEAVSLVLAACLRVYGRTKITMFVSLIANIITVFGNIIVLYVIESSGLTGVACSTLIGRLVAAGLLAFILFFGLKIQLQVRLFFHWSKQILKNILHIGLPSAGENLLWIAQYAVAYSFIGLMGETAVAAHNLFYQTVNFITLFGASISIGNEIFVGYYTGAQEPEKAYHRSLKSLKIGIIGTIVVVTLIWFFRETILHYLTEDGTIIALLLPLFTLSVFLEPGRTNNIVMVNALRASGDAWFPFCMAIIFMWGVSLPLGYYLGIVKGMGLLGIWLGFFADEWLRGLMNVWRWRSKRWQNKRSSFN